MNLGDPELELIDPTPNIYVLFVQFDKIFFWTKLANRAVVRWSKRMYSCAGVCSYEGRGGLCDIALSEPLLKLRPRKDLVETLLHEMIHAYLFITNKDRDRDGHGPNFKSHMCRINQIAGLNISIYHSFHEEVELYQTHWWRCDGSCQQRRPNFGIIRRSMNKAPGPTDFWWDYHQKKCGGTFIKIKEPEKPVKKNSKAKPNADITKYITNNNNIPINVLKDSNNASNKSNVGIKSNSSSTVIMTKKGNVSFNPKIGKPISPPVLFSGNGHILSGNRNRSNSIGAAENVRNIWANKQLPNAINNDIKIVDRSVTDKKTLNPNKHKANGGHIDSPPMKIKKIDDYFKSNASAILKDVYGGDFKITQSGNNKLIAVSTKDEFSNLVNCPVCNLNVNSNEINRHLDECLNKDIIAQISPDIKQAIDIGTNKVLINKEEAENEINRLKSEEIRNLGKYAIDYSIDLTGNRVISTRETELGKRSAVYEMIQAEYLVKSDLGEDLDNARYISHKDTFDVEEVKPIVKNTKVESNIRKSNSFDASKTKIASIPKVEKSVKIEPLNIKIKEEPVASNEPLDLICPCCGKKVQKPVAEHFDVCIGFFNNDTTIPGEGTSSISQETIVIDDDDDIFDETQTLNATGTKSPCPCCLEMIEDAQMNEHLDSCLK